MTQKGRADGEVYFGGHKDGLQYIVSNIKISNSATYCMLLSQASYMHFYFILKHSVSNTHVLKLQCIKHFYYFYCNSSIIRSAIVLFNKTSNKLNNRLCINVFQNTPQEGAIGHTLTQNVSAL